MDEKYSNKIGENKWANVDKSYIFKTWIQEISTKPPGIFEICGSQARYFNQYLTISIDTIN